MAKMLSGSRGEIMMMLLFQVDRQLEHTDVRVSHGHGGVPMVRQLVSKHRSPGATCDPMLNTRTRVFQIDWKENYVVLLEMFIGILPQCKEQHGKRKCWVEKERDGLLCRYDISGTMSEHRGFFSS